MNTNQSELKAKLAAAEAELKKLRDAAEQSNTVSDAMKAQIIRSTIAARHAVDVDVVEALVSRRIAMSETGELFATDSEGMPLIGTGPDFGNVGLDAYLDRIAQERPALFKAGGTATQTNPFKPGPRQNITEGMRIFASDPDLGRALMNEAGYGMRND